MVAEINRALDDIEHRHDVRVLYAVESGSRAWGFASVDSDYDVRFVYVHRRDWYLSIHDGRDVIEEMLPGDLDMSGWDIKKALRLLQKSNPPLIEWLNSPIVYRKDQAAVTKLQHIAYNGFSPKHCAHHYLSIANTNFRTYLQGDLVRSKKYLYVLRPLMAARWIADGKGIPPVLFSEMVAPHAEPLKAAIHALLAKKVAGAELDALPRDDVLHEFIQSELESLGKLEGIPHRKIDPAILDALFREVIG